MNALAAAINRCLRRSHAQRLAALKRQRDAVVEEAERHDILATAAAVRAAQEARIPHVAFVTFHRPEMASAIVGEYGSSWFMYLCQGTYLRYGRGGDRLWVVPAPPPDTIEWSNLRHHTAARCLRRAGTAALTLIFVIVTFVGLFLLATVSHSYSVTGGINAGCGTVSAAAAYGNYTKCKSVDTDNQSVAISNACAILNCFCASDAFLSELAGSSADYIVNELSNFEPNATHPYGMCPQQACTELFALSQVAAGNTPVCVEQFKHGSLVVDGVDVATSLLIGSVYAALALVMLSLSSFEGHHSTEQRSRSLLRRLFIAQFAVMVLLTLLVNMAPLHIKAIYDAVTKVAPGTPEVAGLSDFDASWYVIVGLSLMASLVTASVSTHAVRFTNYVIYVRRTKGANPATARSQRLFNARFRGPDAVYALSWATAAALLFSAYIFATGLPVMNLLVAGAFTIMYWAEKLFFTRLHARPRRESTGLAANMTSLIPWAVLLHLAFGAWMISAPNLWPTAPADPGGVASWLHDMLSAYTESSAPNAAICAYQYGVDRLVRPPALPYLMTLALVVLAMLGWAVVRATLRTVWLILGILTCGIAHKDASRDRAANAAAATVTRPAFGAALSGGMLEGLPSYNMLEQPRIGENLAISPEFARAHRGLASLGAYRHEDVAAARTPAPPEEQTLRPAHTPAPIVLTTAPAAPPLVFEQPPSRHVPPATIELVDDGGARAAAQRQPRPHPSHGDDSEMIAVTRALPYAPSFAADDGGGGSITPRQAGAAGAVASPPRHLTAPTPMLSRRNLNTAREPAGARFVVSNPLSHGRGPPGPQQYQGHDAPPPPPRTLARPNSGERFRAYVPSDSPSSDGGSLHWGTAPSRQRRRQRGRHGDGDGPGFSDEDEFLGVDEGEGDWDDDGDSSGRERGFRGGAGSWSRPQQYHHTARTRNDPEGVVGSYGSRRPSGGAGAGSDHGSRRGWVSDENDALYAENDYASDRRPYTSNGARRHPHASRDELYAESGRMRMQGPPVPFASPFSDDGAGLLDDHRAGAAYAGGGGAYDGGGGGGRQRPRRHHGASRAALTPDGGADEETLRAIAHLRRKFRDDGELLRRALPALVPQRILSGQGMPGQP